MTDTITTAAPVESQLVHEHPIAKAVRHKLVAILDEPVTGGSLARIEKICRHMREILVCLADDEEAIDTLRDQFPTSIAFGQTERAETMGARIMREIVPAISQMQAAQGNTPDRLMKALEIAKDMDELELADRIRKQLDEVLGVERPE